METILIFMWILLVLVIAYFVLYNEIIKAKNSVENNLSTIQTVLQNRYDLIPQLVEVVKQYTTHEKSMIELVTTMRNTMIHWNPTSQSIPTDNDLSLTMKSIFALSENYPELKADTSFKVLQNQRTEMEDRLQWARRSYNFTLTTLRNKQETYPSALVAWTMNIDKYELFTWQKEAQSSLSTKDLF